jgi:hypothetical protein
LNKKNNKTNMDNNLLNEYKQYYAIRAERYANNENYKYSYEAEKKLSEAMQSSQSLEDFKNKMGNLNELCANALVKDETLMEKAFYEKHKENVRILDAERILQKVDSCSNATDLGIMITEETNKNSMEITSDEAHRVLVDDWFLLDKLEIYENAEVPSEYKSEMKQIASDIRNSIIENARSVEEDMQAWENRWRLKPEILLEYRHKRLFPYEDKHIEEQIARYKSIINR